MIDLKQIPFSEDAIKKIETSLINYKRFAGVEITIRRYKPIENWFEVEIRQTAAPTGKILTHDELISRGQDVFDGITPEGISALIIAYPYM